MSEFYPRDLSRLRPLFVQLNVFAAPLFGLRKGGWGGVAKISGNSQASPLHPREGKSALSTHPCVLKSSAGAKKEQKGPRKLRLVCARGSLMLITALRNDVSRPGKRLKTEPLKLKGIKGACQLKSAVFSVSVRIHLAPFNGIKVYSRRHVCIKYERFHLLLCI